MGTWNAMTPEGRSTILEVVREEAAQFFDLVDSDEVWEAPTGAGHWQVRDVAGHLVDTTEACFVSFDAARNHMEVDPAYGLPGMAVRCDQMAQALRSVPRTELVERAHADFHTMMETFDGLTDEDWTDLLVPHFYMGPLPSFFYPAFQLMDYGVHSWDVRQGTGRAHGLSGRAADLLTPFMFVLWQYTTKAVAPDDVCEIGIRITSGPNAGDTRVSLTEEGFSYSAGSADLEGAERRPGSSARGLHHVAVVARDVEETIRFYQGVLGFPLTEIFENRDYKGSNHFFFDIGNGNLLAFFDFPGLDLGPYAEVLGGLHHIAISVGPDAWQRLRDRLDDAGVEYLQESGTSIYFRDPNGARLELIADPLGEMYGTKVL